jgi:hypothetical protein
MRVELDHRRTKIMGALDDRRSRHVCQFEMVRQLNGEALRWNWEPLDEMKDAVVSAISRKYERCLFVSVQLTQQMLKQSVMHGGGQLKHRLGSHAPSSKRPENPFAHETRL